MDKKDTCCFTGHRPNKLPWGEDESDPRCLKLKADIAQALENAYDRGYRHFICGMAQGCDLYFCEAVQALRGQRPGITVEAAIPCEEQASRWSEADRDRYFSLVGLCDYETMVQRHYDRACMLRRNRYMVDRSVRLIAVYNGVPKGGTFQTLQYAMKKGLSIHILDLEDFL